MNTVKVIETLQNLYDHMHRDFVIGSARATGDEKDLLEALPVAVEELKKNLKRTELLNLDPAAEEQFSKQIKDHAAQVVDAVREAVSKPMFSIQATGVANSLRFIADMVEKGVVGSFRHLEWNGDDVLEGDLSYRLVVDKINANFVLSEEVLKAPEELEDEDSPFFTYTSKEGNEYAVKRCDCFASDVEVTWNTELEAKVVQCQSCGKSTHGFDGEPEAIAAWNVGDAW